MNMQQLIQNAQKMQREYEKAYKIIEQKTFEYTANGLVKCVLKGDFTIEKIEFLDKEALSGENKEMLEEMISLAYNGCKDQIMAEQDKLMEKYKGMAGGFPF